METSISCLINVDGINYKIDLKSQNEGEKRDLNCLKRHLLESGDEEISQYDIFNSDKFTIEVFDTHFQEFIQADDGIELADKTKLRVRSLDETKNSQSTLMNEHNTSTSEDEFLIVNDIDNKRHLVNIVTRLHFGYALNSARNRRRSSNYFIEERLQMKDKFWVHVAEEMAYSTSKCFTADQCSTTFFGLLSQYQYILRKYKRSTEERCQTLWPFFKSFHHKIECKLFARLFGSLQGNWNSYRKEAMSNGHSNYQKKSECTRLEEDFNLITSVLTRISSFKKPPRAAAWRGIADDMADYNSHSNRLAGFRWQKRFHELLNKFVEISSQGSQLDKESWPFYNLLAQIDIELFMKPTHESNSLSTTLTTTKSPSRSIRTTNNNHSRRGDGSSLIPIDLSDSESEFVVIDEVIAESDRDTPCVDLEKEEDMNDDCIREDDINEIIQELLTDIVDQVILDL